MYKDAIIKIGQIKLVQMSYLVSDLSQFIYVIKDELKSKTLTEDRLKELVNEHLDWYVKAKGGRKPYK